MHAFPLIVEVDDVLGPREVLTQEVGRSRLERLPILHHRLDAEGVVGTGEPLGLGLATPQDRHRHPVVAEVGVDIEHASGVLDGLLRRRVGGVPLLPEELRGTQEEPRPHLPPDDVGPLVDQQRKVAVRLDPAGERLADDGLGRRPDHQRLVELAGRNQSAVGPGFEPMVRDDGAFLRKAFHMLGLLLEEPLGNEEREVGVAMPRLPEHPVEDPLALFPERAPPGLDDHAPTDRRRLGQIGGLDDLLIPLGVVLAANGRDGGLHLG